MQRRRPRPRRAVQVVEEVEGIGDGGDPEYGDCHRSAPPAPRRSVKCGERPGWRKGNHERAVTASWTESFTYGPSARRSSTRPHQVHGPPSRRAARGPWASASLLPGVARVDDVGGKSEDVKTRQRRQHRQGNAGDRHAPAQRVGALGSCGARACPRTVARGDRFIASVTTHAMAKLTADRLRTAITICESDRAAGGACTPSCSSATAAVQKRKTRAVFRVVQIVCGTSCLSVAAALAAADLLLQL